MLSGPHSPFNVFFSQSKLYSKVLWVCGMGKRSCLGDGQEFDWMIDFISFFCNIKFAHTEWTLSPRLVWVQKKFFFCYNGYSDMVNTIEENQVYSHQNIKSPVSSTKAFNVDEIWNWAKNQSILIKFNMKPNLRYTMVYFRRRKKKREKESNII